MIEMSDKSLCSGCQACQLICPAHCIDMIQDMEGFVYPKVNQQRCIECHLCENICPILNQKKEHEKEDIFPIAYGAVNKCEAERLESSSGGLFLLLAQYVIHNQGVVFGAKFDEKFNVIHGFTESIEGIYEFQGSKYVQSDVGRSYCKVKEYLEINRLVLFSGTPCQIGGLKAYLCKDYDNLICVDIICHGVPSPFVWRKYIDYREKQAGSPTQRIFFRHKKNGWKKYVVLFEFANNTTYERNLHKDLFMKGFLKNLYLRPSCYHCAFKGKKRYGDITLADFWGIEEVFPEMDDDKGASLVLIHSSKGMELFHKIRNQIICNPVDDIDAVLKYNSAAVESVLPNENRTAFFRVLNQDKIKKAFKKYCDDSFIVKIKKRVSYLHLSFIMLQ